VKRRRLGDLVGIMAGFTCGFALLGMDVTDQTAERIFDLSGAGLVLLSLVILVVWVVGRLPRRDVLDERLLDVRNRWMQLWYLC
jgi:hypothetical protein